MVQHGEVLEGQFEDFGYEQSEAYVNEWASLNRREVQRFIDPTVDLTTASIPSFGAADWILPFGESLALASGDLDDGDEAENHLHRVGR